MDKEAQAVMEKTVTYIAMAQPQIDAFNDLKDKLVKQAHETAAVLVHCGIIPAEKKAEAITTMSKDPSAVFELTRKMAQHMSSAPDLGSASAVKTAASEVSDPFVRWVLYGRPDANGVISHNI